MSRVLVVEDDPQMADLLRELMEEAGHTPILAPNGRTALARAAEADLVLMDVGLPDIDGVNLCQALRADPALARTPVVMITAHDTPRERVQGLEAGADDYIVKPFDAEELVARVDALLRTRIIEEALRERTRQLETLRHLTSTLVNTVAVDDLAQRIVDAIPAAFGRHSGFLGGLVCTVDGDRQLIRAHAVTDIPIARRAQALLERPLQEYQACYDPPRNLCEATALHGEPHDSGHLADFIAPVVPTTVAWAIEKLVGMRGGIAQPVKVQGRVVGVLLFVLTKPVSLVTANERALMVDFATTTGIALENVRLYAEAERLTMLDPLTGVANRRHFDRALEQEVQRSLRQGYPLGLLLVDVDHFKAYNDAHGHLAGDDALRTLAEVLTRTVRGTDLVARYGGEEFAVVLPATSAPGAHRLAERLRQAVEAEPGLGLTISVGAAALPHATAAALIDAADRALYAAKHAGRNRTALAEPP